MSIGLIHYFVRAPLPHTHGGRRGWALRPHHDQQWRTQVPNVANGRLRGRNIFLVSQFGDLSGRRAHYWTTCAGGG